MKRILIFSLVLCMALSVMTSCKKSDSNGKQTVSEKPDDNAAIKENTPNTPISLAINNTEVSVGDVFTISVTMKNDEWSWNSFEFVGTYDPSIIKINKINKTELTNDMLDMSNLEYGNDGNQFKVAFASGIDLEGGGDIIEIECEALKAGTCEIKITEQYMCRWVTYVETGEGNTQEIPVNIINGVVTVKDSVSTPILDTSDSAD